MLDRKIGWWLGNPDPGQHQAKGTDFMEHILYPSRLALSFHPPVGQ